MASIATTAVAARTWQRPAVIRVGLLGHVAIDNRGGNGGGGRWNGNCKGKPCWLS